jgi:phage terminase small subunit
MALSKKQRDFVAAYVECWHATKAAVTAGYSERSAYSIGSENLKKPEISAAIEAHISAIMPKGEVVQRLAEHARGDLGAFFSLVEEDVVISTRVRGEEITTETAKRTVMRLDLEKAEQAKKLHLIKSYSLTDKGQRIELYDAQAALRDFVRMHGLGKEDGGILKYLDLSKLTKEQLQRLSDGDDPIAVLLSTTTDPSPGGAGAA